MARTYIKKTKMDTNKSFTDFLSPEEMEFFPNLEDICLPQYDESITDDVYQLANKEIEGELLFQELDLHGGSQLLDADWFTEKFDFSSFNNSVLTGTTDTLPDLADIESSFCGSTLLEFSNEHVIAPVMEEELQDIPIEIPEDNSATSEQKVPEYQATSPFSTGSVPSPSLASSIESNPASPLSSCSTDSQENTTLTLVNLLAETQNKVQIQPLEESTRKRGTPYTRSPAPAKTSPKAKVKTPAQKQRKRVQNKDAATRYRVKKRSEHDVLFQEAEEMQKQNTELKEQVASISKEIEYLKNLMVEVCKNKQKKQANMITVS